MQEARAFQPFTRLPQRATGICGLRTPVAIVFGMIAYGMTAAEVVEVYPDLELADVQEALRYAADAVRERELPLAR